MAGEIELVRSDIHELNNPVLINHKSGGPSDVVRINSQSVVHTVTLDDAAVFVR